MPIRSPYNSLNRIFSDQHFTRAGSSHPFADAPEGVGHSEHRFFHRGTRLDLGDMVLVPRHRFLPLSLLAAS